MAAKTETRVIALLDHAVRLLQEQVSSEDTELDLAHADDVDAALVHLEAAVRILRDAAALGRHVPEAGAVHPVPSARAGRESPRFEDRSRHGAAITYVEGACLLSDVPELLAHVRGGLERPNDIVVVDFTAVPRIDHVVAAALLHLAEEAASAGKTLRMAGVHGQPATLLTRLEFPGPDAIVASVDVALGDSDVRLSASFAVPPDEQAARRTRTWMREICTAWAVPRGTMNSLIDVGSELVANAVTHGAPPVTVLLEATTHATRIAVRDHSARPATPAPYRPGVSETGLGLHLVRRLSTSWGQDPDPTGKTVWAVVTGGPEIRRAADRFKAATGVSGRKENHA